MILHLRQRQQRPRQREGIGASWCVNLGQKVRAPYMFEANRWLLSGSSVDNHRENKHAMFLATDRYA